MYPNLPDHSPLHPTAPFDPDAYRAMLDEIVTWGGGNKNQLARRLGISRQAVCFAFNKAQNPNNPKPYQAIGKLLAMLISTVSHNRFQLSQLRPQDSDILSRLPMSPQALIERHHIVGTENLTPSTNAH
jgi:hypothetical protein